MTLEKGKLYMNKNGDVLKFQNFGCWEGKTTYSFSYVVFNCCEFAHVETGHICIFENDVDNELTEISEDSLTLKPDEAIELFEKTFIASMFIKNGTNDIKTHETYEKALDTIIQFNLGEDYKSWNTAREFCKKYGLEMKGE